jgi:hypothetical protein
MRRSPDFERFRYAIDQGGPWTKDTIDTMLANVGVLPELTGPERLEAEDLAIASLLRGDTRAARPLADAGCGRAIPVLRAMADARSHSDRLRVATALLRLGVADGSDIAITVLDHRDSGTMLRIEAAELLAAHPTDVGQTALRAARNDANPEVRRAIRHLLHGPVEFGVGAYFVNVDAHDWANDELMSTVRAELPQALAQRGLARYDGPPEHVAFGPDEGERFGEKLSRNDVRFSGMVQDHFGATPGGEPPVLVDNHPGPLRRNDRTGGTLHLRRHDRNRQLLRLAGGHDQAGRSGRTAVAGASPQRQLRDRRLVHRRRKGRG